MATEPGEVMGTFLDTTFEQAEAIIAQLKPQKQNVTCPPEEVASLPINRIKHTPLQQETALHQDKNITEMYKEEIFTRENGIQGQFLQKAVLRREDKGVETFRTEKKTRESTMQATSKYSVQEQDAAQSPSEQSLSEYVAEELQAKKERTTPLAKTTSKEWHGYEKKQEIQKEGQVKRAGSADEQLLSGATKSKERDQLELRRCFTREKESSASGNIQGNQLNLRSLENVGGERSQEGLGGRLEKQPIPCPQKDSAQVTSDVASTTFLGSSQHMETTQQLQRGQLEIRQGTWAVCSKATTAVSEKDEQEEQDEHPIAIRVVRSTEKQLILGEDSPGSEYIEESLQLKGAGSDEEEPIVIKVVGTTEQQPSEKPASDVEESWKQGHDEIQMRKQLISSRQKGSQRELISAKVSEYKYSETTRTAHQTTDVEGKTTRGKDIISTTRRQFAPSTISFSEQSEYIDESLQAAKTEQARKQDHPKGSQEPVSEYMEESLQSEGGWTTMEGTRKQETEGAELEGISDTTHISKIPEQADLQFIHSSQAATTETGEQKIRMKDGLDSTGMESTGSVYLDESLQMEGKSITVEETWKEEGGHGQELISDRTHLRKMQTTPNGGDEDTGEYATSEGSESATTVSFDTESEYMEGSQQPEGGSMTTMEGEGARKQELEGSEPEVLSDRATPETVEKEIQIDVISVGQSESTGYAYLEGSLQLQGGSVTAEETWQKQGPEVEVISDRIAPTVVAEQEPSQTETLETGEAKIGMKDPISVRTESAVSAHLEASLELESGSVTVEEEGTGGAEQEVISDRTPPSKLTEQDDFHPKQAATPAIEEGTWTKSEAISVGRESTRSVDEASEYFEESFRSRRETLTAEAHEKQRQHEQTRQVHGIDDGDNGNLIDGKNLVSAQSSVSSKYVDNKSFITENETREVARRIQEEMHLLQRVSSTEINKADSAAASAEKSAEGKASSEYRISAHKGAGTREYSEKSDIIAGEEERESVHSSLKQIFGNRFDMDDYELVTYNFKIRISQEGAKVITACASSEETEKALDAFIEITPDAVRVNDTKVWGIGGA